ncbi:polyphosphate kinase [Yersinia intermedia]|uniref:polyphosphate kinase n=1 Tax=Yersinia intermedia TaxID=631 RepID=UPI0022FDFB6A|nr:polyphosphate kinase [Yersinia intermedia]MDA5480836.1 polyphosphate kinase [Yersinia intermedia]
MTKLTDQEYVRKPDGGLAEQIEVLEAMAEGDAENTELLMLLIELRSLREQRVALKGEQVPVAVVELNDNLTVAEIRGDIPRRKAVRELYEGALVIGQELFTAAKPAEIPRHIYSMLVNELRDVPAIGCKRELIIGVLNRHGVTAEPVQLDPPATE